jgi:hypothetical protein
MFIWVRNYINVRYLGENMHMATGGYTLALVVGAHLIYGDPSACISRQQNKLHLLLQKYQYVC